MYHQRDNLFFGRRMKDGAVRILKFSSPPKESPHVDGVYPDAVLDVVIPQTEWASAVACVSHGDETDGRFQIALDFHGYVRDPA